MKRPYSLALSSVLSLSLLLGATPAFADVIPVGDSPPPAIEESDNVEIVTPPPTTIPEPGSTEGPTTEPSPPPVETPPASVSPQPGEDENIQSEPPVSSEPGEGPSGDPPAEPSEAPPSGGPGLTAPSEKEIAVSGGSAEVPIKLTADATTFSVSVPTVLPVYIDTYGDVYVADDAKIVNHSIGPVEVKGCRMDFMNGWTITDDLKNEKVNAKKFIFDINGSDVTTAGTCDVTGWIAPIKGGEGKLDLIYHSDAAAQANATVDIISNVVFTVGWYSDGTVVVPPDPTDPPEPTDPPDPESMYHLEGWISSVGANKMSYLWLYAEGVDDAIAATETFDDFGFQDGYGWAPFSFDLEELPEGRLDLVLYHPGAITYTRTDIVLTEDSEFYDPETRTFTIDEDIVMIPGDVNDDGTVGAADEGLVMNWTNNWTDAKDESDPNWKHSVHNPESEAYASDINGDGRVTEFDRTLVKSNFGKRESDYGSPSGLG